MYQSLQEVVKVAFERLKETNGLSFDPTVSNVVKYYNRVGKEIIKHNTWHPLRYYDAYPFDWTSLFTPIEKGAWNIIRSLGRVVLYPQYPVLNYRPDFANPVKKIILECDGKDYHDAGKDKIRDQRLWEAGWRVFRVTGSELYKITELEEIDIDNVLDEEDYESRDGYTDESLREYYLNTAEGVISAIRAVYFLQNRNDFNLEGRLQLETLKAHQLVKFPI